MAVLGLTFLTFGCAREIVSHKDSCMRVHYSSGLEQVLVIGNSVVRHSDTHVTVKGALFVNGQRQYGADIEVTSASITIVEGLCY